MAQIKKRKKNKLCYLAIQKVRFYFCDLMTFKTWGKYLYLEAFILRKTKQHETKTNQLAWPGGYISLFPTVGVGQSILIVTLIVMSAYLWFNELVSQFAIAQSPSLQLAVIFFFFNSLCYKEFITAIKVYLYHVIEKYRHTQQYTPSITVKKKITFHVIT